MAHSEHTEKEWVQAARRMPRHKDGSFRYPTVISRKPRLGDIHPVSKSALERRMPGILIEYLYGLKRIELRARRSSAIGVPFGVYYEREHIVALYSLPLVWELDRLMQGWQECLVAYQANVKRGAMTVVSWPSEAALELWFWDQVVMHELGHHFVEQYRNRNGRIRTRKAHEGLANLHVGRYLNRRFQRLKQVTLPPLPEETPMPPRPSSRGIS